MIIQIFLATEICCCKATKTQNTAPMQTPTPISMCHYAAAIMETSGGALKAVNNEAGAALVRQEKQRLSQLNKQLVH